MVVPTVRAAPACPVSTPLWSYLRMQVEELMSWGVAAGLCAALQPSHLLTLAPSLRHRRMMLGSAGNATVGRWPLHRVPCCSSASHTPPCFTPHARTLAPLPAP